MKRVAPKKHLGQHFLKDENTALRIVRSLKDEADPLIEVGAGTGVLTQHLVDRPNFIAYDVDEESIEYLHARFPAYRDGFIHGDFLKAELKAKCAVIGNFPYNISSQLFFKVYENHTHVMEVVCMVQKEVADRIASSHGNKTYGILSVLLQAYYDIEYLFDVSPGVFDPPPKVMSGVIRLVRNQVDKLACDEKLFKRVVKAGFGKRRKTLRNALKELNLPAELVQDDIFNLRAEQLAVGDFITLTRRISESWK